MEKEPLKTIGILGGMSSASTGEYYQLINQKVNERRGGHHIADLLIYSVDFAVVEAFVRTGNWEEGGRFLAEKSQALERAGASCIFLATNTMHRVRDAIQEAISIPFVDIFEIVAEAIKARGLRRIGILGTYPVMSEPFFVDAFRQHGIEIIAPDEAAKREINRVIFEELTHHHFLPRSKDHLIKVIQQLSEQGAEGVILGCTEIKMLISQTDTPNIPLFDTTELHCDMAAKISMGEQELPLNKRGF